MDVLEIYLSALNVKISGLRIKAFEGLKPRDLEHRLGSFSVGLHSKYF